MSTRVELQGSKMVKIQCRDCPELSEPFRVTLYKDGDGIGRYAWKDLPQNWQLEDEAELYDDIVYGYCPQHLWPDE